ncbi:MAG TPA: oxidoreductase [Novosphingobium sp.]|nr:oxidoreductase [Novosphingobium sp.]
MKAGIATGLVGYGMAGRVFHVPLIRAVPALHLAAIATSRADEVAALGGHIACVPDIEALLADPAIELIVIATPSATHASLAMRALAAGKHVVVDKPMALSLAEARELVEAAKAADRRLFAFHNRRWDSCFMAVRAAIEAGEIGRVTHFESHFDRFRPQLRDRWREDGGPGSGVWYDLGPHLVDQAVVLFGRPQAVSADIAALRQGGRADDFAHVLLHYPDRRVVLQASLNVPGGDAGGSPRFFVAGESGAIEKRQLDPQEAQLVAGLRPGDAGWGVDADPLVLLDGVGGRQARAVAPGTQQRFYAEVARALIDGSAAPNAPSELLIVAEVIEAAFRSAREGRVIRLD